MNSLISDWDNNTVMHDSYPKNSELSTSTENTAIEALQAKLTHQWCQEKYVNLENVTANYTTPLLALMLIERAGDTFKSIIDEVRDTRGFLKVSCSRSIKNEIINFTVEVAKMRDAKLLDYGYDTYYFTPTGNLESKEKMLERLKKTDIIAYEIMKNWHSPDQSTWNKPKWTAPNVGIIETIKDQVKKYINLKG